MSFGKKAKSNDKKATDSLKPANFYSPFGNVTNGTFIPIETNSQINTRNTTLDKLQQIVGNIPTTYNVNEAYNNPYYSTMLNLTRQPIDMQRQQDFKELDNALSARNQLGSSYDAYQRHLTNQRYDNQYRQAENQARLGSSDAYQQAFQNSLAALQGLRNDYTSAMDTLYRPAQLATGYQNAMTPLQTSLSNYYANNANYYRQMQAQQNAQLAQSAAQAALMFI